MTPTTSTDRIEKLADALYMARRPDSYEDNRSRVIALLTAFADEVRAEADSKVEGYKRAYNECWAGSPAVKAELESLRAQLATCREELRKAKYYRTPDNEDPEGLTWLEYADMMASQLAACQKECEEQARLNGMGGEREAGIRTKIEAAEAELAAVRKAWNDREPQLLAAERNADELRADRDRYRAAYLGLRAYAEFKGLNTAASNVELASPATPEKEWNGFTTLKECEAMEADKKRLDWIASRKSTDLMYFSAAGWSIQEPTGRDILHDTNIHDLRAAIDAAMQQEGKS